jgi:hypothetical protein
LKKLTSATKFASVATDSDEEADYREEANAFLQLILQKNVKEKKVSVILEFAVGKAQDMIQRMIQIYEPAILVVGTRGKSMEGFKGLLPGSVSKYCLQHSPVPVVVVRPYQKREKKKAKREADLSRRQYRDLLTADDSEVRYYQQGSTGKHLKPQLPAYLLTPINTSRSDRSRSPSFDRRSNSRHRSTSRRGSDSPFFRRPSV